MDKLFYYVSQTDWMLPKYLGDVEERSAKFAIDTSTFSAGVSDDDDSDGLDEDDNDNESGGDDAEPAVESDDSGESDDDDNVQ